MRGGSLTASTGSGARLGGERSGGGAASASSATGTVIETSSSGVGRSEAGSKDGTGASSVGTGTLGGWLIGGNGGIRTGRKALSSSRGLGGVTGTGVSGAGLRHAADRPSTSHELKASWSTTRTVPSLRRSLYRSSIWAHAKPAARARYDGPGRPLP